MDDPENFEVIEAYNRLSLLLEQQQTNFSFEKEIIISPQNNNQRELHNIMENKIDMLAHLISSETKEGIKADNNSLSPTKFQGIKHVSSHNSFVIDNQNSNKNVNNIKNNHDKSNNIYDSVDYSEKTENFDKNYSSKTIIPHMEELINVLVKNKIAKDPINNSSNTENAKFFSSMKSSEKPKKSEKRNNVVYTMKKTKFDAFAIFKVFSLFLFLLNFFQRKQQKKKLTKLLKDFSKWINTRKRN